ncbi:hypothetical protein BDF20DRAFT_833789 [Mycotypha africana]|uniref:uncharacterized protein n=1 Tax=Mycotypha africana TaxID=64632 RepID=UPI0023001BE7|nr:uncharacterized protein BDF20DRAFT_833789 [Mycotypha africana]KAI8984268.1 hypothetical protein BDF20DRAFT_833789 [Mycotypha africana]
MQHHELSDDEIITSIYKSCFSKVSTTFLEKLVREIAAWTGVQTVMIQRLLTAREYNDLRHNEGCPQVRLIKGSNSKSKSETSPLQGGGFAFIDYLFIKACYSKVKHPALTKYSAAPITSFDHDAPHIQTIRWKEYHDEQNGPFCGSVYPVFHSFVGLRLDQDDVPIGMIAVMDDRPMDASQIKLIKTILSAVELRTVNEIGRLRYRDNLIVAKNAALQDAESKIKFLADMSHEIRTPMNAVIALTDLLLQERNLLNVEQAEHLEVIQTSGNHLLTVINDILDITKINHDPKFKLENRRFSIRKCVKDALNMARHQASMIQHQRLVHLVECPPEVNDNIPLNLLLNQLGLNNMLLSPPNTRKAILPLLWKIESDVPDHLVGDSMRLTQILLNLCSNAVKFTKSGGIQVKIQIHVPPEKQVPNNDSKYAIFKERYDAKIESMYTLQGRSRKPKRSEYINSASASEDDNCAEQSSENYENGLTNGEDDGTTTDDEGTVDKVILEISVTDTGIGMPADRLPRLFKSFSQIDISTARRFGGTGLGLAISSTLVNRMGGGLWVESEEGIGSKFALTIPLAIYKKPSKVTLRPRLANDDSSEDGTNTGSSVIASPSSPGSILSDSSSCTAEQSALGHSTAHNLSPSSSNHADYFSTPFSVQQNNNTCYRNDTKAETSHSLPAMQSAKPTAATVANRTPSNLAPSPQHTSTAINTTINTTPNTTTISSNIDNNYTMNRENIPCPSDTGTNTLSSSPGNKNFNNSAYTGSRNNRLTLVISKGLQNFLPKSQQADAKTFEANPTPATSKRSQGPVSLEEESPIANISRHIISKSKKSNSQNEEENLAKLHPIKIMLAEDNILNQKIAVSILKRLGYQDVVIAGNGREALELMRIHKFDVIFMDLYMPEMDGLEATRHIVLERKNRIATKNVVQATDSDKSNEEPLLNVNDVYIIALTASASTKDRQICIDAGMNDFISKPFTMMEMKAALKSCVHYRKRRQKSKSHKGSGRTHKHTGNSSNCGSSSSSRRRVTKSSRSGCNTDSSIHSEENIALLSN